MSEVSATVGHRAGVHARPASEIVKAVRAADARVTLIGPDGAEVDARSMLGLMRGAYLHGQKVRVRADGPDADRVAAQVADILSRDE